MNVDIHKPERDPKESQSQYRLRQKSSRAYFKQISSGIQRLTPFKPSFDNPDAKPSRAFWFTGDHHNLHKNEMRKAKKEIGARQFRKRMKAERTSLRQSGETR